MERPPQSIKQLHADDYRGQPVNICQGQRFQPFNCYGFTVVESLPFLKGRPWDDIALGYVHALRPTSVRVIAYREGAQLDSRTWRVTVHLDEKGNIRSIEQEVQVGLPDGHRSCRELNQLVGLRRATT